MISCHKISPPSLSSDKEPVLAPYCNTFGYRTAAAWSTSKPQHRSDDTKRHGLPEKPKRLAHSGDPAGLQTPSRNVLGTADMHGMSFYPHCTRLFSQPLVTPVYSYESAILLTPIFRVVVDHARQLGQCRHILMGPKP